jgi:hypothetical protein
MPPGKIAVLERDSTADAVGSRERRKASFGIGRLPHIPIRPDSADHPKRATDEFGGGIICGLPAPPLGDQPYPETVTACGFKRKGGRSAFPQDAGDGAEDVTPAISLYPAKYVRLCMHGLTGSGLRSR